jgi:serine/threonine protein phosphatase PrpC
MRIEAGVATDIGKVRDGNEDSFLVEPPLYAVADGMGGHRGGEVASHLALETVEALAREGKDTLAEQVRAANRAVYETAQQDRAVTGMGTTLTAARIVDGAAHLAHVGDSRAYLQRGGSLRRLTDDHTLVNRMVKAGEITPDEAAVHPHRNVLTRALGTEPEVKVDVEEVVLMDGDRLLLCSDGLFGMVNEDQIQAILEADPDPQKTADRLVRAANRAGGVDNITVVVLDAHGDGGEVVAPVPSARAGGRRAIGRWIAGAGLAVVIVSGGLFLGRAYVDDQWYVGVKDDRVAIYRGVPAQPLGYHLSKVVEETDLTAAQVQQLELYTNLPQGINADSEANAQEIVAQMRTDLKASQRQVATP